MLKYIADNNLDYNKAENISFICPVIIAYTLLVYIADYIANM